MWLSARKYAGLVSNFNNRSRIGETATIAIQLAIPLEIDPPAFVISAMFAALTYDSQKADIIDFKADAFTF